MRPLLLVLAASILAGCTDRASGPAVVDGTFPSVDDGAANAGFAVFRDSLRAVVARRDTAALVATVGEGARLSFGDAAGGPDGLRAMWFAGSPPGGEPLWAVLGRLLDAGSVEEDGAVTVPYVFGAWPDSVDVFTHVAVVGDRVEARLAGSDTAGVAALVSHAILPVGSPASGPATGDYQAVRLPDGTEAFVPAASVMSPVGYRATFFPDEAGAWKLQTLVAGD